MKNFIQLIVIALLLPSVFPSGDYCSGTECGGVKIQRAVEETTTPPLASGPNCVASIDVSIIPGSGHFYIAPGSNSPTYWQTDYQVTVKNTGNCLIYGGAIRLDPTEGVVGTKNVNRNNYYDFELVISSNGFNAIAPGSTYTNATITYATANPNDAPQKLGATIEAKCPADCIASVQTSSGCQAATVITAKPNTVRYNSTTGKNAADYDVLIVNYGGCPIYEVDLSISVPSGAAITNFNFQPNGGTGKYKFNGFRTTADTLDLQNRYTTSLTAEFTSTPIDRFSVQTTSLCTCKDPSSFSSPAPTNTQCSVIVTAAFIRGSGRTYPSTNGIAADYEVFAANYGSCPLSTVTITFAPFQTSYLTNATGNLKATAQQDVYTLDASSLTRSGATSAQATITDVFAATGYARYVPITSVVPQCGGSCSTSDNQKEVTESAPTTAPASTAAPSAPSSRCVGSVNLVQRTGEGSSWTADGTKYVIFDVSVVNQGACAIDAAAFPYYFVQAGVITSSWNLKLDSPKGYGSVTVYSSVQPGATYTGAGVIVANYTSYSGHYSASPVTCSSC